ncbi:hypothetical protein TH9_12340 [Thalassospira xiamenensis]|nr:hypothetical protein TH9_12340 [Thalassospira xiamenensis]
MKIDSILHRIKSYRAAQGLNASQWAKLVGLGDTTFRNMHSDDWNPTVATIRQCEKAIPPDFMNNANDDDPADAGETAPSDACSDRGDNQNAAA